MAGFTSFLLLSVMAVLGFVIVVGPPYFFSRHNLNFLNFIALPLGTLIPWAGGLIVVLGITPWVDQSRQAGFGWTPILLFVGAGIVFLGSAWLGAFFGTQDLAVSSRLITGMKWSSMFVFLVTIYILYLAFSG